MLIQLILHFYSLPACRSSSSLGSDAACSARCIQYSRELFFTINDMAVEVSRRGKTGKKLDFQPIFQQKTSLFINGFVHYSRWSQ
jgi:hypothetical protein